MNSKWLENNLRTLHEDAYKWARQCCQLDDDNAKDVLQMVYLKILEGKAKYNEKSTFKTWLFSVIRFTAIDHNKTQIEMTGLGSESITIMKVESQELSYQHLLNELTDKQKQLMLLVFYHEQTIEQAAHVMNISLGTARTHYDRGKKKLKELITKQREHEATY